MKKRILIADDHPIVRAGLVKIVNNDPDVFVADEACNCQETIRKFKTDHYDLVVLDITMPDGSGLDVLKELRNIRPNLPVLILSIHPEDQYAIRTLRAGASGYLTKTSAPNELMNALRAISQGKRYITATLSDRLASELAQPSDNKPHEMLSDREFEVMCMLAAGQTIKHIGKELGLSEKTISTYRSRMLEKTNMTNNAELARYALENNLI